MTTPGTEAYRADWEAWRAGWEQWLAQPHNWLSAVAVTWLDDTPRRFDGTPGRWWQDGDQVVVDPDGATMAFDGLPHHHLRPERPGAEGVRRRADVRAEPGLAADGTVTLDFNRAIDLPCAFGDFFPICPTPPAGNRYPFRIEAGEKTPGGRCTGCRTAPRRTRQPLAATNDRDTAGASAA